MSMVGVHLDVGLEVKKKSRVPTVFCVDASGLRRW